MLEVSLSVAKARLTDLVKRVEAGEEVMLTRHGHPVVRLEPVARVSTRKARAQGIARAKALADGRARGGAGAARSQDFLYDEHGLPA